MSLRSVLPRSAKEKKEKKFNSSNFMASHDKVEFLIHTESVVGERQLSGAAILYVTSFCSNTTWEKCPPPPPRGRV